MKLIPQTKIEAVEDSEQGHSLFIMENGVIRKALDSDFEEAILINHGNADSTLNTMTRRIKVKEGCKYITALNMKNAIKKFNKLEA